MKIIFVFLLCFILSGMAFSQKTVSKSKPEIDSLSFHYDVREMTIMVGDTPVHYSVVFDPESEILRSNYIRVWGKLSHYEAIKYSGEKYRNGLLVYKKREDIENEK